MVAFIGELRVHLTITENIRAQAKWNQCHSRKSISFKETVAEEGDGAYLFWIALKVAIGNKEVGHLSSMPS